MLRICKERQSLEGSNSGNWDFQGAHTYLEVLNADLYKDVVVHRENLSS